MWSENSSLHLKFNKFIYTNVQPSSKYYMKDKNLKRFHIIVCFFSHGDVTATLHH